MSLMFIGYKIINVFRINRKVDVMITSIEKVMNNLLYIILGDDLGSSFCLFHRNRNDRHDHSGNKRLGTIHGRVQEFFRCFLGHLLPAHGPAEL